MNSKEGPELSYCNICIIQYPYGIRIDQTSHFQYTILTQWFPDAYEKFNSAPTPFKSDNSFELYLADILPTNPFLCSSPLGDVVQKG